MVKHTQTICQQQPTNCLSVFGRFVGWRLKGCQVSPYSAAFAKWEDRHEMGYFITGPI